MIEPTIVPGAVYGDALPEGEFVYSLIGKPQIVVNGRAIDAPAEMMFNRLTNVGGLKVASKSHNRGDIYVWNEGWTATGIDSPGVQGHGWRPDGELSALTAGKDQESQGLRYFDPSVPASLGSLDRFGTTAGWVTGSPTYNSSTPLAQALGVAHMSAWTRQGDVTVGQEHEEGAIIHHPSFGHRWLAHGDTQFIHLHREGDRLAIAITRLRERDVLFFWFSVAEIATLPVYQATTGPARQPIPDPSSEKPPIVTIPDLSHIVEQIHAEHPQLLEENSRESCNEFLWRAADAIHKVDSRFGLLTKSATENHTIIGGERVSVDALTYKVGDVTSDQVVDIMLSAGDGPGKGGPTWSLDERKPSNLWMEIPPFPEDKPEDPKDPKDPDPPSTDEPDYDAILAKILDKIEAVVKKEIDRAQAGLLADIRKELDGLVFEAKHRLLGTITFTRKKE